MQGTIGRGIRRRVRRAVTWRPLAAGTETVDVARLVAPLRYDVLVRAEFLEWLSARLDEDPRRLAAEAEDLPYGVWYRQVEVERFRPHLASDPQARSRAFADRVARTAALVRSFEDRGFDAAHPVRLRHTRRVRPADSGLTVDKQLHVGDGGHRLALLLRAGLDLEPEMYVVDPRPFPVIDNTAVLARHLDLDGSRYAAFLGPWYVGRPVPSVADLVEAVTLESPDRLPELRAVMARHLGVGGTR